MAFGKFPLAKEHAFFHKACSIHQTSSCCPLIIIRTACTAGMMQPAAGTSSYILLFNMNSPKMPSISCFASGQWVCSVLVLPLGCSRPLHFHQNRDARAESPLLGQIETDIPNSSTKHCHQIPCHVVSWKYGRVMSTWKNVWIKQIRFHRQTKRAAFESLPPTFKSDVDQTCVETLSWMHAVVPKTASLFFCETCSLIHTKNHFQKNVGFFSFKF